MKSPSGSGRLPLVMHRRRSAAMLLGSVVLAACTTESPTGSINTSYMISVPSAPFYKYGPAQTFGADFTLGMGQRVTMLSKEFGYSRVMMDNGVSGYVATEDLKPAPPPTPTPKPITPKPSFFSGGRRGSNPPPPSRFKPSPDPLFDVSDVPSLPLPKDPEKPETKPTFRY